ncbi:phytosulfokine receptor 2-like [Bidens hawaiensis]|uniref:phytosulfokine receptor 2-like n=1 Tax=Bidens hawaiensis TaxID=980011 RepID=UPI004049A704
MASNSAYLAILAAIATFFVITLIFSIIYFIFRIARKRPPAQQPRPRVRTAPDRLISISENQLFDPSLNKIDMVDLVNATRNFSPDLIVGDGSFGYVYKARLTSGVTVAVKKLGANAFQGAREFRAEMETLGNIQHKNIVTFLGYCKTGSDRVLIYKFIEKGSVDQWLYDTSSAGLDVSARRSPLSWRTRVNIIKGVAKGLEYMHNLEKPIIHRDIKVSNILLDADFEAHIADFGLARMMEHSHSHVSTQVAGTMGYMPPEYFQGATAATVMGDVYSFGILMFEVATARRPNLKIKDESGNEVRFVEWAMRMVLQNEEMKLLDGCILKDDLNVLEVLEFFKIAAFCIDERPKERPSMKKVVELLDQIYDETTI